MGLFNDFFRRGREGARQAAGDKPAPQAPADAASRSAPPASPAAANPTAATTQPRTYTVRAGDTLSAIAERIYGDPGAYMRIFEANRDILRDPDLIHPGQTLKLPQ